MSKFILPGLFVAFFLLTAGYRLEAQTVSKVIVVNGGRYETAPPFADFVTVGLYDPATGQYQVKDTIPDQAVQDLEIVGDTAIIVSENGISTYRLPDLVPISRNGGVKGIRNIVAVGSRLFGARGFGSLPGESLVYVFDRNTLVKTGEVAGIPAECEDIAYSGNKLYVSMPGGFGSDSGSLVRIDPTSLLVDTIFRLGTTGTGIGKLATRGDKVYAFISLGFGSSASAYAALDGLTDQVQYKTINISLGYTLPSVYGDTIYADFGGAISKLNFEAGAVQPRVIRQMAYSALALDTVQNTFYVTEASFTAPARLYTMTRSGSLLDSVTVGVSAEKLAVFYQSATGSSEKLDPLISISPIPVTSFLNVKTGTAAEFRIVDLMGREFESGFIKEAAKVNVSRLPPGVYLLSVHTKKGYVNKRFVKE